MSNQLMLGVHFLREIAARRYEYEREPEPDLVMDNPDNVREYRDAGLATGNGSSVYLFNQLLLSSAIQPGATVIDLACGPANLLVELAVLHPQAHFIGIDLSSQMLACANELKRSADAHNVDFIQADITALDMLRDDQADLVMSTLSLHHLPALAQLQRCASEIARITRPSGHVHLMDFASLKRHATARYFVHDRTAGLGPFLASDYANSLRAAYRIEHFQDLLPVLRRKLPGAMLRSTFGVPFLIALTSIRPNTPDADRRTRLAAYWRRMRPSQQADFDAMRLFFLLGGLQVPHPRGWN